MLNGPRYIDPLDITYLSYPDNSPSSVTQLPVSDFLHGSIGERNCWKNDKEYASKGKSTDLITRDRTMKIA